MEMWQSLEEGAKKTFSLQNTLRCNNMISNKIPVGNSSKRIWGKASVAKATKHTFS